MASCPNCGFDLADGFCPVCGFGRSGAEPAEDRPAAIRQKVHRWIFILGIPLFCLVGAAVLVGVTMHRPSVHPQGTTAQPGSIAGVAPVGPSGSAAGAAAQDGQPAKVDAPPQVGAAAAAPTADEAAEKPARVERAARAVDLYSPTKDSIYDISKVSERPPLTDEASYASWMVAHTGQQEKYLRARWQRAQIAVQRRHITRERILAAFLLTPREWFVRSYNLPRVYDNTAMPIGYGQTISGPDLVARMTDYLDPQPDQRVLEIGTGSGYQSAFLSHLSNNVYTIEIVKPLAEETNAIYLARTKEMPELGNIHRRMADGYYGWPEFAPFDRIIVTAGIDHIPPELLKELSPGGIMVIPVGPPSGQTILKITKEIDKSGNVVLAREDIYHGYAKDVFVPFTAATGGTHYLGSSGQN